MKGSKFESWSEHQQVRKHIHRMSLKYDGTNVLSSLTNPYSTLLKKIISILLHLKV